MVQFPERSACRSGPPPRRPAGRRRGGGAPGYPVLRWKAESAALVLALEPSVARTDRVLTCTRISLEKRPVLATRTAPSVVILLPTLRCTRTRRPAWDL